MKQSHSLYESTIIFNEVKYLGVYVHRLETFVEYTFKTYYNNVNKIYHIFSITGSRIP